LFVPIAVETSGVWTKEALKFLREVRRRIAVVTGEKRFKSFLLQGLSPTIQRGNAASLLGTVPPEKDWKRSTCFENQIDAAL